jgi:hypothetical protein
VLVLPIIANSTFPFSPISDEMKRRRDFYAAHPSADGKFWGAKDILCQEENYLVI